MMIFDEWLDLPIWGIFAALALGFGLSGALIHWLSFGRLGQPHAVKLVGVVAPFFSSVAILFALLTGFLANDVWDRNRVANRAILAERDGLLAVHAMSVAVVSDMSEIRAAAQAYARSLVEDEWPLMRDQESSVKADEQLLALLARVSDPKMAAAAGQAAQGALLDTVLKLRGSRYDRLAMSGDRTDRTKWTAVLILGLITQIAIGVVHLERPKAQLTALSIFSLAAIITLGLVAIRERPFDGELRFSPAPIEEALAIMTPPPKP
ncbi:DUF4239 domain-containing protein [Microvirga antarctica]|uniref:bestrophin-like domain n=1 Tax=Microvirga antarctica TaxID=2819233 RepID=UPI001B312B79|nr:DUF4239 domain-containing protein [Microvirga antarctica]